jgi:hypothetical protein
VAEQKFRGLMIHMGWKLKLEQPNTSVVAVMMVILWKAIGGNWEAAFAAGAFYIMLITFSPTLRK